jgi:hypothetical protein
MQGKIAFLCVVAIAVTLSLPANILKEEVEGATDYCYISASLTTTVQSAQTLSAASIQSALSAALGGGKSITHTVACH